MVRERSASAVRVARELTPDAAALAGVVLIAAGLALSPFPFLSLIWLGLAVLFVVRTGGS
jgi:hypothetical protein